MIRYSSYLTFMCCVIMWGKIKCIVATAGEPPMIRYSSYLTFMCCVNMWGKIQVFCGNSGWPADDNMQQLSHIYVLCQHVREDTSVMWQQRVTRRWYDTAAISHLCVVSTCEGRYKFNVVTAGNPPMISCSSYLKFMCCVNMWAKIQFYCGNSGWPADDKIQQLSHIYMLCQHVREDTNLFW